MSPVDNKRSNLSVKLRRTLISAALLAFALLITQMVFSGRQADAMSIERQKATATIEIEEIFEDMKRDQRSVTIWDDAIAKTSTDFDFTWIWENLGTWMNEYYDTDRVYILDAADRTIYNFVESGTGSVGGTLPEVIEPMVRDLRAELAAAADMSEVQTGRIANVDGHPSYILLAPIVASSDRVETPSVPTVHIMVKYLDDAFAALGSDHIFADAHYAIDASDASYTYVPVPDGTGYFAWTPHRPGMGIILANAPLLAAAAIAMTLLLMFLGRELGRLYGDLQSGEAEARRQARLDHLTGLPNRMALAETMDVRLKLKVPTAAIYVDIDNFKNVNDALGHPAGDELIKIVGARLSALVGDGGFVARIGGDEFAVLCDVQGSEELAAAIVRCIHPAAGIDGFEIPMTASVGLAVADNDELSAELLRRADIALYQAKASGRDCYMAFAPEMDDDARRKRTLERDLRLAMAANDQLHLAFQPLYSGAGAVVGVETLVRWRHPSLGDLPPPVFIKIAEESGLITQLGEWILERACTHAVQWDVGYIAVNVSALQFRAPGFVQLVADILKRTGLSPTRLELELTENLLADLGTTHCVAELRAMGISIALDDFGTGFSSLNYLRQFPVDKIKVDRSFVQQAATDPGAHAIVVAMVRLANALGLEITAEGVETEEQRDMLIGLGCHQLQGFLMSRPLTPETFSSMLVSERKTAA